MLNWRRLDTSANEDCKDTPPWWRHQMETFSASLALCAGNSPVPVNSPHKGQRRGALMFSLICVWINGWVNNREAGDLRRYRAHYDVSVMTNTQWPLPQCLSRPSGKLNSWPIVPDDRGFFSVTGKSVYHAASISCRFLYIFRLKFWCAISYKFTGFYENETHKAYLNTETEMALTRIIHVTSRLWCCEISS